MAVPDGADESSTEDESLLEGILDVVMTGVAIIVPLGVTLYIIQAALDKVTDALTWFVGFLRYVGVLQEIPQVELVRLLIELEIYGAVIDYFTQIIAITILFGVVVLVGFVGRHHYGKRVIDLFDLAIASIPGVGTVYKSFRRMGDVMLDDGAENFQEIKLVQCLDDDMYVLAFKTSSSPKTIETSTGHEEMVSMFIPLAPNPVTGGFLTHVPEHKVYDIDMTIEEGVRSILTSGIASGDDERAELTMGSLDSITDLDLQNAITVERDRDDDRD